MKKNLSILVILITVSVFSISAQGYHRAYGNTAYYGDNRFELKEYSGSLKLEEGELPELELEKTAIQLLIPVDAVEKLELTDGREIRVKGLEFRKRFFVFKGKTVLKVNEIETGGNTYFISDTGPLNGFGRGPGRLCW